MSSGLIKANYYNNTGKDGKRIIDSNPAVSDRLQFLSEILDTKLDYTDELEGGFSEGLNVEQIDALFEDSEGAEGEQQQVDMVPTVTQEDIDNLLNEANEEAQRIIAEANNRANAIIEDANVQAEAIKNDAFEAGRAEGTEAGYQEGLAQVQEMEKDLNERIRLNQEEYENAITELEPRFVEVLTDIYSHIFRVDLSDKTELVLHLLHDTIRNIDNGQNYFVHVSSEDYEYVKDNRDELKKGLASTCIVEVIEDMSLGKSECFIEAEGGIFYCSLDTQLINLKKELSLLSFSND